jgi:chitin synthase
MLSGILMISHGVKLGTYLLFSPLQTIAEGYSRVEGEIISKQGHDDKTAVFDGTTIPLRRWEDWERSRLRKLRREERRRKDMERHLGNVGFYGEDGSGSSDGGHKGASQGLQPWAMDRRGGTGDSDTGSMWSSDEDVWGGEIGGVRLPSSLREKKLMV